MENVNKKYWIVFLLIAIVGIINLIKIEIYSFVGLLWLGLTIICVFFGIVGAIKFNRNLTK